ncbi:type II toxin-antitoxin system VapC family toxin [Desulfurococcus amylolyticus]|uniref:PilT protein domain protein n=1 Tax=Desulfurococcus amylolyticus DSM 16532 TaxID=768672 RepID=I3XR47_DESAM|nr:PIN domain-containing protein [Desulfurococcus amylolyticus]AFL66421.1 PilT protein domain protein [Desulfurococcus amylolyticus DSM 16532]
MSLTYIDTSVIISYIDEADPSHDRGVRIVNSISGKRGVSKLTLVELTSVYSRAGLENPIELAIYSIRRIRAEMLSVDFNELVEVAVKYAPILKLKTLDLLHLIACFKTGCKAFATLDNDIIKKASVVNKTLGIEIITAP